MLSMQLKLSIRTLTVTNSNTDEIKLEEDKIEEEKKECCIKHCLMIV